MIPNPSIQALEAGCSIRPCQVEWAARVGTSMRLVEPTQVRGPTWVRAELTREARPPMRELAEPTWEVEELTRELAVPSWELVEATPERQGERMQELVAWEPAEQMVERVV